MFDQRFTPPAAIECTARIEADAPVGDLTLVWCETDPFTPGRIYTKRAYLAQTGAYDNTFAGISGGGHAQLAQTNFILEPGRSYRLRLEVDNEVMQLIVDGQVVAVHRSAMPFGSGWFGMLGYYRGKSFSDVAIYSQSGKQWGPLTVGDAFLTHGHLADAASEYANAATLLESEPMNQAIARYRQGVALAADGHHAEATAIWNTIAISPWMELGAIYALRRWIATGDHATVAAGMTTIGHSQDQRVIDAMREVWGEGLSALGALPNATEVMQYIHVRHACFPNDAVTAWAAAQACWRIGRFKEALAEAGSDRRATAWSLLALGRADEVLATYPEQIQAMGKALLQREKYDIALAAIPQVTWAMREVALATGRFEEASKVVGSGSAELAIFRIVSGEAATIAADPSESQSLRVSAALLMDDLPAVTELANGNPPYEAVMLAEGRKNAGMDRAAVLICRLLEEPSDPNEIEAIVSELGGWGANATWTDLWFARQVVLPWLKEGGDHVPPALFTDLANLGHVPAPRGECLAKFIIGAMDEAQFLDQPAAMDAKRYLPLAKAMREEVAGNNAAALTAYRGFMALPPWQRPQSGAWMRNVIVEWFARWRIRHLQG
jgi:tetratricopeptide (TPR) repeat protein